MKLPRSLCGVLPVLLFLLGVLTAQPAPAQIYWIEAPEFAPPNTGCTPEFGDLDGDGDCDLIYAMVLQSYRNVGSPSVPSWHQDNSLVEGVEYVNSMTTCLADLDADGDLDLSVGELNGWPLLYYQNVGSAEQPIWQRDDSMYEGLYPGSWTCPELADLDDDGDLDLVLAVYWGLRAYRNTGTPNVPSWTREDSLLDGISLTYGEADPNLGDLDCDGDLDVVLGSTWGGSPIMCFENAGTSHTPVWVENEDLLTGVDRFVDSWGLDLTDIDGDGDLDLLVLVEGWGPTFYLNCGPITPVEPVSWSAIKAMFR